MRTQHKQNNFLKLIASMFTVDGKVRRHKVLFIITVFLLGAIIGLEFGKQTNSVKIQTRGKRFNIDNGLFLDVYRGYINDRISRMTLYNNNKKDFSVDIWFNYNGSVSVLFRNTLKHYIITKYDMHGKLYKETIINKDTKEIDSYKYTEFSDKIQKNRIKPDKDFTWLTWFTPKLVFEKFRRISSNLTERSVERGVDVQRVPGTKKD